MILAGIAHNLHFGLADLRGLTAVQAGVWCDAATRYANEVRAASKSK
ncbi:MAG: hypothetical protein ABF479_05880 [Gluconacetobacter sp.]